jgi:hypothetical protein
MKVPLVLMTGSIIAVAAVLGTSVAVCGFAAVDTMLKVCPAPQTGQLRSLRQSLFLSLMCKFAVVLRPY